MTRQTKVSLLLVLTAIVFAFVGWVDAGLVTRPTKTCGNLTYTDEVADGCTTILAADVDADLTAIINSGVNNITTDNLASDSVSTVKIQNLAVTTGKLNDLAVTTGKLADLNVTTGKLANGAVTAVKVQDATSFVQVFQTTGALVTPIGTNTSLVSQAITMGRTHVRIAVNVYGQGQTTTSAGTASYTLKLTRDASAIYTAPDFSLRGEAGNSYTFPITASFVFIDTTTAAAHTYAVTLTETDGGNTTTSVTGRIVLEEIL